MPELKLIVLDADDLAVISAHLQDAGGIRAIGARLAPFLLGGGS